VILLKITTVLGQKVPLKTKVSILGTVHFGQTSDLFTVKFSDLLSATRQNEFETLTQQLAEIYPNKIFVENTPDFQGFWDKVYADARKGIAPTHREVFENEIYQIGIRLALKINDPFGVICVNYLPPEQTGGLKNAKTRFDSLNYYYSAGLKYLRPDVTKVFSQNIWAKNTLEETLKKLRSAQKDNLTNFFRSINSESMLRDFHYLNQVIWLDDNLNLVGAETASKDFLRNARIFQNMLSKINPYDKHVILIIGAAHVQSLKTMIQSHPRLEYVEILETLQKK
jgi:hypothetical protein